VVHRFKSDLVHSAHFVRSGHSAPAALLRDRLSCTRDFGPWTPVKRFLLLRASLPMPKVTYDLRGKAWRYAGQAAWVFVTLPKRQAGEIRELFAGLSRGASLPAVVTVGKTTWKTSIFTEKASDSYVLPLKAEVRKAEGIEDGDTVAYRLEVAV
jgi:hypothetical protein